MVAEYSLKLTFAWLLFDSCSYVWGKGAGGQRVDVLQVREITETIINDNYRGTTTTVTRCAATPT